MRFTKNTRNLFCFNGPFDSGIKMDTQNLINKGYKSAQKSVHDILVKFDSAWYFPGDNSRSNNMIFDINTYQGQTILPDYFIGYYINENHELFKETANFIASQSDIIEFNLSSITIKYYNNNVGTISFSGNYTMKNDINYTSFRNIYEEVSSNLIIPGNKITNHITAALSKELTKKNLFQLEKSIQANILWMHRIYYVKCKKDSISNIVNNRFALLSGAVKESSYSIENINLHIFPEAGSSLQIYTDSELENDINFNALEQVINYFHSCWQVVSKLDAKLFFDINELTKNNENLKVSELETKYNLIIKLNTEINLYKTLFFNKKINLSPQEAYIWDLLFERWKIDEMLSEISNKSEYLKDMSRSILERVENKHNSRLNYLVFVFTIISFITIILQALDFIQKGFTIPDLLKIITLSCLIIIILFFLRRGKKWLFS